MRTPNEGAAERYISIGEAIGETRALSTGEYAGMAIGIITTARDLGAPDSYIVERLMDSLGISEAEAQKYIDSESSGMRRTKASRIQQLRIREAARRAGISMDHRNQRNNKDPKSPK